MEEKTTYTCPICKSEVQEDDTSCPKCGTYLKKVRNKMVKDDKPSMEKIYQGNQDEDAGLFNFMVVFGVVGAIATIFGSLAVWVNMILGFVLLVIGVLGAVFSFIFARKVESKLFFWISIVTMIVALIMGIISLAVILWAQMM